MYFTENEKKIKVIEEADILVCGGGPAGIGAALRAGREGLKTVLIKAQYCLGGVATAGLMSHWVGYSSSEILEEIYSRQEEKNKILGYNPENECPRYMINQEALKIILDEMMAEAGVKVLYGTKACAADVSDGRLKGVIVENKSGRGYISAKCTIDATGDGDIAAFSGAEYFTGRETDRKCQPCTLMFKIGGVDYSKAVFPGSFETLIPTAKGELQSVAKKLLPFPAGHVLLYRQFTDGTVCCNMTNAIGVDATDAESLSKAITSCRLQIEPIIAFLREYAPGYENCWLMDSGEILGVRESRHFVGEKSLGAQDILDANIFDDWVVRRAFFNFDVHNLTGASLDKTGVQKEWKQQDPYSIPYGCLLPKGVENLLLSGRNISGSHLAHSNFRVMPICIATGEAAGIAASIMIKENLGGLREVEVKKIQAKMGL
ncbi:MAG: FAD-dependent oxidoreductase [Clostridia bacterium]|nr:FAD-dependent oxidoreductase [Clostridia bacterium]